MKQSEYNEIDSLLRQLAGSENSVRAGSAKSIQDDLSLHLDADELNSYAEGALPVATRARYTSHLADCDDCRRELVQLAMSSGVMLKPESDTTDIAVPSRWKQILAAFFTPSALRYALPAMVVVIMAAAFLAWRQQLPDTVALNRKVESPSSPPQTSTGEVSKPSSGITDNQPDREKRNAQRPAESNSPAAMSEPESAKEDRDTDKKAADAPAPGSSDAVANNQRKEKETARAQDVEEKPRYAAEAGPRPAPQPTTVATITKAPAKVADETTLAKDKAANKTESAQTRGEVASTEQRPSAKTADGRRKSGEDAAAGGRAASSNTASDDQSETRSVSGRRFQKRNNSWIDSAYKSSMSTTSVARGSEQYRALIADEPGIAAVANQLDGDVFLVWKGHAYHIH